MRAQNVLHGIMYLVYHFLTPSGLAYLFEHVLLCHVDGDFVGGGAHVSKVNRQVTYPLTVKTSVHLYTGCGLK